MKFEPFALERYFAQYEFSVEKQLSSSDCETVSVRKLLSLAADAGFSEGGGLIDGGLKEEGLEGEVPSALLEQLLALPLGYTESAGDPRLREMIARRYGGSGGSGGSGGEISVLTAAPAEAIFLLFSAILSPGDRVMVIDPAYQSLASLPRSLGCEVIPWKVRLQGDEAEQRWNLDLQELDDALSSPRPPKLVVANFPHNPTGYLPGVEDVQEMARLCDEAGTLFFCDEMYRELSLFGRDPLPAAATLSGTAISLGGLSKSFGLPGLRMGWLASRNKTMLKAAARIKDYTTICSSGVVEFLARAALTAEERLVERARLIVEENIKRSRHLFTEHELLQWIEPSGGSVAFPRYLGAEGSSALSQRLIQERNTLMLPGTLFGFDDNHFRVGLGRKGYENALNRAFSV